MKYDKIRGKSLAECKMQLRSLYGDSAIIISQKEIRDGGLLGSSLMSKKLYEIEFMVEERSRNTRKDSFSKDRETRPRLETLLKSPAFEKAEPMLPGRENPSRRYERTSELVGAEKASRTRGSALDDRMLASMGSMDPLPFPEGVATTKEEISALLEEPIPLLSSQAPVGVENDIFENFLSHFRKRLKSAAFSDAFITQFIHRFERHVSPNDRGDARKLETKAKEKVAELVRISTDLIPPRGEAKAVMLIGPTGSGKTTSLAKIATKAKYQTMTNRPISIYSLDQYRLAATEQLKSYSHIVEIDFHAPITPEEFREDLERDGAELILIDTSGIGHKDTERLKNLQRFIAECEIRLEKHLVLSASTSPLLVDSICKAFLELDFDKILLTKLDESDFFGPFLEAADKLGRPFSLLMNGQDVAGDMQLPDPQRIASAILGS